MQTQHCVTVSNIGEVYAGTSRAEANAAFREYRADSLTGLGRAGAETVTQWADDEITREFSPVVYDAELTDTYAGEANYSWVRRAPLVFDRAPSRVALVRRAKAALGITGAPCRRADYGDMIQLNPRNTCTVAFITYRDI